MRVGRRTIAANGASARSWGACRLRRSDAAEGTTGWCLRAGSRGTTPRSRQRRRRRARWKLLAGLVLAFRVPDRRPRHTRGGRDKPRLQAPGRPPRPRGARSSGARLAAPAGTRRQPATASRARAAHGAVMSMARHPDAGSGGPRPPAPGRRSAHPGPAASRSASRRAVGAGRSAGSWVDSTGSWSADDSAPLKRAPVARRMWRSPRGDA
jgi:hypothetical protein